MVNKRILGALLLAGLLVSGVIGAGSSAAYASEAGVMEQEEAPSTMPDAVRAVGLALAAALVLSLSAMATARVQSAVGAGGTGALAEKPELITSIIILIAIPETLVILGFVLGYLIFAQI